MKAAGYALAFPTDDAGPRIWFNFQHDVLYFDFEFYDVYPGFSNKFDSILRCSPSDRADFRRVKNIAFQMTANSVNSVESLCAASGIMLTLNHVEKFLIVEQNYGDGRCHAWGERDTEGDLWGYIECDVSDVLGHLLPCRDSRVAARYISNITEYKKSTRSHGRDYFQHLARTLEQKLERHRDLWYRFAGCRDGLVSIRPGHLAYSIPKIRFVTISTRIEAKRLTQRRKRYWEAIQEIEDEEAEAGPKPISGHDAVWEDSIGALYTING